MFIKKNRIIFSWKLNTALYVILIYLFSILALSLFDIQLQYFDLIYPQSFFLVSILILILYFKIDLSDLGVGKENLIQNILLGLAISLGFFLILWLGDFLAQNYLLDKLAPNPPNYKPIWDPVVIISMIILAPILEEIIFRGLLFPSLKQDFGIWLTLVLCPLIFMMVHLKFHPGAFLLGLATCILYLLTNSVISCIILHAACNLSGLLIPTLFPHLFNYVQFFYR